MAFVGAASWPLALGCAVAGHSLRYFLRMVFAGKAKSFWLNPETSQAWLGSSSLLSWKHLGGCLGGSWSC